MNVLLICAVPDPKEHPRWAETADNTAIREAVRGLCQAVVANAGTLFVPPQPAIVALVRSIVPLGMWVVVDDLGLFKASRIALRCAVMIGGTDAELAAARAVRADGVRVYPVASTGGASVAMIDECPEFSPVDWAVLAHDTVYGKVFETILSL